MGTAWETLFHLSRFMKYLLIEVLPKEGLDSPKYVSESLIELIDVTRECLNVIRNGNGPKVNPPISSCQPDLKEAVNPSLESSRNNTKGRENDIKYCTPRNELQHNDGARNSVHSFDDSVQSKQRNSFPNNTQNVNSVIKHNSTVISQNFISLNNNTLTGNCFGYYCLPCDSVFTSENEWKGHCDNWDHLSRIKKTKWSEFLCADCNLLILGNMIIAPTYIDFHRQKKHMPSFHASSEFIKNEFPNRREFHTEEPNPEDSSDESSNSESIRSGFAVSLSSNFKEIQSKMIMGIKKEGFYCDFCGEQFCNNQKWMEHLQKKEFSKKETINGKFTTCDTCSLTIFADKHVSNQLIVYHNNSHESYLKNSQNFATNSIKTTRNQDELLLCNSQITAAEKFDSISRPNSKTDNTIISKEDEYNSEQYCSSSNISINKDEAEINNSQHFRKKKPDYIFSNTFLNINDGIHSKSLVSAFYCRPCDKYCLLEESEEHCLTDKHVSFINSKMFNNFQGKCRYCKFTIIGTERTVHEYMRFHAKGHKNVPSYSVDPINEQETCEASNDHKARIRRRYGRTKKENKSSSTIVQTSPNTTCGANEYNAEIPLHIDDSCTQFSEPIHFQLEQNNYRTIETNEHYSSPESFMSKLIEMYTFRVNEKCSQDFAGFCIPCKSFVESAFDWVDHLGSSEHCSIQSASDEELNLCDINLRIFGNKTQIQKHSII